uniref:DDE Tnp4 domain-containing protein n=1 Tax=Bombyx mori TaxID=7091 RepID=A0A8R2DLS0_BOMMO|nr:putative nuclease HARBI1 [Bombyx mori]
MSEDNFNFLLTRVSNKISKQDTICREALPAKLKLQITLRLLASGNSFKSLSYEFKVSSCSISKFVPEILNAVYQELKNLIEMANTEETWSEIVYGFSDKCNFPFCGGAIDDKHVQIRCPARSRTDYYNYKRTFSIVLLAVCDSNLKFRYINVGHYGRASDGGFFARSNLKTMLEERSLNAPEGMVLLGDHAFPLTEYLMTPYSRRLDLSNKQKIFNYRLSRARRTIENTFGVLVSKFRIFEKPIPVLPETVDKIIKTCCVLHNWLKTISSTYIDSGIDEENPETRELVEGSWRKVTQGAFSTLRNLGRNHYRNVTLIRQGYTTLLDMVV